MKKVILALFSLVLIMSTATAQEGKSALKKASKALGSYNLNTKDNKDKLDIAVEQINIATNAEDTKGMAKTWNKKGEIYNASCASDVAMKVLDPTHKTTIPNAAYNAYEAFEKGLMLAQKKYEKKDALSGLLESAGHLNNQAVAAYESQNYEGAFMAFKAVLDVHKLLKDNDNKSTLDAEEDYKNQLHFTALAAMNANKLPEAKPFIEELYNKGADKASVFEALFKLKTGEGDEKGALVVLEEGRQKFPDDVSLLFAEINYYLQANKLDVLVDKLKSAIEKEPDNIALYTTLGRVYDNLYQAELKEGGDPAKADELFNNAKTYYDQALVKVPDSFDALYSLGSLYYNRAVQSTEALNALADDFSKAGMKKYDAQKAIVQQQFDEALPYFQKTEVLNPNDHNTLTALNQIYARKDDLEKTNEFKARLDNVRDGGTNTSFFKQ